jgi:toxin FitB
VIILDTNVVSELMRPGPAAPVIEWVNRPPGIELYLSAITAGELLYGVARLPEGRRNMDLTDRVAAVYAEDFNHRIVSYNETAAAHCADIVVSRERSGRPISHVGAQIAATCRSHGALLATRNVDDFIDAAITIVNPWRSD